MQHKWYRFHARAFAWKHIWSEEAFALLIVLFIFISPVAASTRFTERSLFIHSVEPGITTTYDLSMRFMTPVLTGSVDLLACIDPIPYHPCVPPPGLDLSNAILSNQSGEIGFAISDQSTNHIILTRSPNVVVPGNKSTYTFENVVNPTLVDQSFSIRLRSHASTDATGPLIDFGSVKSELNQGISIETQVPPMLIFCVGEIVYDNCAGTNNNYYTDMGELAADSTLTAQSQMAVGTNATAGFAITVNGGPPAAGTNVIDAPAVPTTSAKGTNQFGINLVENTIPTVGSDPVGTWANAIPSPDYSIPNQYKFVDGDVLAYSLNVSLMKKFTVSYIFNSRENLRAGVYTTTITYTASGRF